MPGENDEIAQNCSNMFSGTEGRQRVHRSCSGIIICSSTLTKISVSQILSVFHGYYYSDFKASLQLFHKGQIPCYDQHEQW